ncbi:diguanylate cyclase [Candidatus Bipolaricaulota bacterium]|nr:diguanylate cyclase [Candidatus Bipolaricaulota bacterium]
MKPNKEDTTLSAETFRQLFENRPEPTVLLDEDGRIRDVNRRFEEIFGYKQEEIEQRGINELIVPERLIEEAKKLDQKSKQGYLNYETVREGKKREIPVSVSATPVTVEGETYVMATYRDVTARKRAQESLKKEREKLKQLHDAVDTLQQQETEEEVLQTAVEVAENILKFDICVIALLEGDHVVPKAHSGKLGSKVTSTKFKVGEGLAGKTVQKGETIWAEDVINHPDAKPTREDFKSCISVPVGELGILQVISKELGEFDKRDVELAEIVAGHLREELNRVRLEEDLRQQAIRDPLTGLYNRRYFNETLKKEVQKAKRYDNPLAFLMIDVDRFKEINDRYSHQTGDEVLREVADLLEENVRSADTVVRYGGDEFLVMMPETNGGVTNTVDRLKDELDRWNERADLVNFPLTLAMGVSHWKPDQERDVEQALKEADKKMYEDKRNTS